VPSMKAMLDPRIVAPRTHGSAAFEQRAAGRPDSITAWSQGGFMNVSAPSGHANIAAAAGLYPRC
jgi:hypothetical protein